MDAVGLSIGIVSLYRACYECYSFFTDVKKAEASSSSHMRELEIQQAILKSWGFHWQILGGNSTEAALSNDAKRKPTKLNKYLLTNRHKAEAVFKTLSALFDTLSDQKKLGNRYGIQLKSTQVIRDESEFESSVELDKPDTAAVEVASVITKVKTRLSVLTRFKWAMKDKDNFKKLITNLKAHGDTLYRLCPETAVPSMNIYFVMECVAGQESPAGLKWTSKLATEHAEIDDDFSMREAYQLLASAATLKASVNENRDTEDATQDETLATIEEAQPHMFYLGKGLALFEGQVVYVEMRDYRGPPLDLTPEQKTQLKEQAKKRRDRKMRRITRRKTAMEARSYADDSSSLSELDSSSSSDDKAGDVEPIQIIRPADPKLRGLIKNFFNTFKGDNMMRSVQGLDIAGMIDHTEAEQKGHCSILYRLPGTAGVQNRERPAENLKIRAPVTLQSLLGTQVKSGIDSTLGARFRLARKLVRAVCLLHSSGWLHKNIRAQSVIFFPGQANGAAMDDRRHEVEIKIDVSNPILMGYIFSRPDDIAPTTDTPSATDPPSATNRLSQPRLTNPPSHTTTWKVPRITKSVSKHGLGHRSLGSIYGYDMLGKTLLPKANQDINVSGFTLDYYQHPAKHADPKRLYRHAYDVYSLGILLLEVGLWEELKNYKHSGDEDQDHYERRRWVCETYLNRLRWACGDTYADVVLRCLMIDSSDDEVAKASERELCAQIVAELENCQA